MASSFTILGCYLVMVLFPMFLMGRGRGKDTTQVVLEFQMSVLNNQSIVLLISCIIAVLVNLVLISMNDKPQIVEIEIENDQYKLTTRRPKISSVKIQSGDLSQLRVAKDKVKLSFLDGSQICYKFYHGNDYLGLFIPNHFVWNEVSKREIMDSLKTISLLQGKKER